MLNKDFATEVKVAQEACQQIRIALYIGLVSRARNEKNGYDITYSKSIQ